MRVRESCAGRKAARALVTTSASLGAVSAGAFLSAAEKAELETVAEAIATPGKGITACDEGPGTIGMRFEDVRGLSHRPSPFSLYRSLGRQW